MKKQSGGKIQVAKAKNSLTKGEREKIEREAEMKEKRGEFEYDPKTDTLWHNTKYGKVEISPSDACTKKEADALRTMKDHFRKKYGVEKKYPFG